MTIWSENELASLGPLPWWWRTPLRRVVMWRLRRRIKRCTGFPTEHMGDPVME